MPSTAGMPADRNCTVMPTSDGNSSTSCASRPCLQPWSTRRIWVAPSGFLASVDCAKALHHHTGRKAEQTPQNFNTQHNSAAKSTQLQPSLAAACVHTMPPCCPLGTQQQQRHGNAGVHQTCHRHLQYGQQHLSDTVSAMAACKLPCKAISRCWVDSELPTGNSCAFKHDDATDGRQNRLNI
jgi:hypothetical protein